MGRKKTEEAGFTEPTGEELQARQTGAEEEIDQEMDKYTRMMNDCAGVTDGEVVFWLHRANEKNKSLHGTYLKRYPKETPFSEIFDEARDKYGAGDYVLVAKKDDVMFRKMSFATGLPVEAEKVKEEVKVDPMEKLSIAMERLAVVDKVSRIINDSRDKPGAPVADPTISLLTTMLVGMQSQNTELLKLMLTQRQQPEKGGSEAMLEAIKLGSALAGKVMPEEGEGGLLDLLRPLIPEIPKILSMLSGRSTQPVARPPVPPRPLPPGAVVPAALKPPGESVLAAPVETVEEIVKRRIVEEVKFVLLQPVTPRSREHVIEYIDTYMPDILRQAEVVNADMFAAYVVTLDPAFAGHEAFFADLHKQYMAGLEEEPRLDEPSEDKDLSPGV